MVTLPGVFIAAIMASLNVGSGPNESTVALRSGSTESFWFETTIVATDEPFRPSRRSSSSSNVVESISLSVVTCLDWSAVSDGQFSGSGNSSSGSSVTSGSKDASGPSVSAEYITRGSSNSAIARLFCGVRFRRNIAMFSESPLVPERSGLAAPD